ncbi:MAG: sigma-54-dependent Fis family transcriptional regulator, partial [Caulobacteraceae bacterium]|nr:sigma-54-dependent Fis family transcriptional regulator [Caulobacteraceae bacterium]
MAVPTTARPERSEKAARPAQSVLIADDEPNIRRILQALFVKDGYEIHVAENGHKALQIADAQPITLLITDLIMPDMNGVELLQKIKQRHPDVVVIMITAYATIKTCVDAMSYGASDYITKPFDIEEIRAKVRRALGRAAEAREEGHARPAARKPAPATPSQYASPAMQEVQATLARAAASRATVLLRGESGTGKEVAARTLHALSDRKDAPFVAVSCAALSETLRESELFGDEKNAFTGAATEKKGRFELAHGGTLF